MHYIVEEYQIIICGCFPLVRMIKFHAKQNETF